MFFTSVIWPQYLVVRDASAEGDQDQFGTCSVMFACYYREKTKSYLELLSV